jgi:hypothetical protein
MVSFDVLLQMVRLHEAGTTANGRADERTDVVVEHFVML